MKTFENPILKTEFVNVFGEKMVLVMDSDFQLWFFHEDIVEDFEKITDIVKYVFNEEEGLILRQFAQTCTTLLETNSFKIRLDIKRRKE